MSNRETDQGSHSAGHDDFGGLQRDLAQMMSQLDRRRTLRLLAGASLISLFGCGDDADPNGVDAGAGGSGSGGSGTGGSGTGGAGGAGGSGVDSGNASCSTIPAETEGPYPGDGTNMGGLNALSLTGVNRSDIRSSLAPLSGTAEGIPLNVNITLVSVSGSCAPLANHAIYIWQCDRAAQYSMYTLTTQNYLRGVQVTDGAGKVSFTSIFPACYSGRWPHIHFEIFTSLAQATSGANKAKVSQLALPVDACNAVYATAGYEMSVSNLAGVTLTTDNVFRDDGAVKQLATVTGSVAAGYVANLTVGI